MESLRNEAISCNFTDQITHSNKTFLRRAIMTHDVIDCRRSSLEEMKISFRNSGILNFLKDKPYLWDAAFPPESSLLTPQAIFKEIEFTGNQDDINQISQFFSKILEELKEGIFICN